jgi:hypothetical protein
MTARSLNLNAPPYFPAGHFDAPERAIPDTSGDVIASFCHQTQTGGIYRIGTQHWVLTGPVTLHEFLTALDARNITLPDGEDLQRWLDAVAGPDHVAGAFFVPARRWAFVSVARFCGG